MFPASRCGECHDRAFVTWSGSAHARARSSRVWAAMKRDATCDRCHAPLHAELDEAVGCDGCHVMKAVDAGWYALELGARVRYGPLCDAKAHYFHKMGCAPAFAEAEQCGACHLMHEDGGLPVFTEYEEWRQSSEAADGVPCQGCHMAGREGEVAVGAGVRTHVSDHGMLGSDGGLRAKAVRLDAWLDGGVLVVEVENEGAGHRIPAGLPGKQLVLRAGADEVAVFSKVLVDAKGQEAPFNEAVRLERDDRLAPAEPRRFSLPAPKGPLELSVVWRELSPALAARLKVDGVVERTLVKKTVRGDKR